MTKNERAREYRHDASRYGTRAIAETIKARISADYCRRKALPPALGGLPYGILREPDGTPEQHAAEALRFAEIAAHAGRQYLAMTRPHSQDEDCILNPDTRECYFCQVEHGAPCSLCGGRGYHRPDCLEAER